MTVLPLTLQSTTKPAQPRWQTQNYNLSAEERALRQSFLQSLHHQPATTPSQKPLVALKPAIDMSLDQAAWTTHQDRQLPAHLGILLPATAVAVEDAAEDVQSASADAQTGETAQQTPQTETDTAYNVFDVLDVINPLQHLPVIGGLYRYLTNDQLSAPAALAGGGLYGGLLGLVASAINVALAEETGQDATAMALNAIAPTASQNPS